MKDWQKFSLIVLYSHFFVAAVGYQVRSGQEPASSPVVNERVIVRSEGKVIGIQAVGEQDQVTITGGELQEIIGWSFHQGFGGKKQFQAAIEEVKLEIQQQRQKGKAPEFF